MKINIINLTQHTINETTSGQSFPPSGIVARVKTNNKKLMALNGIPVYRTTLSEVEGLPAKKLNTIYIVSALALNAISKDRTDVVAPGNLQRNENRQPIGCCGFRISQ